MSVFKKLKGSFQTAQQGLFDGLRAVTLFDGHLKPDQLQHVKSKEIDLNAGADLLHGYQEIWATIRNETKVCSEKAESVDSSLAPMFLVWDQRAEAVTQLEEEIKSIPIILSTFKDMHSLLENIRQDFSVVESALNMLENLCEEIDLKKVMAEETRKLNDYKKSKDKEAEKIKVSLAQSHAKRMLDIESTKSMKLKERAEAFTSAFEEDVDYYKTYGQPESKLVTEFPKVSSLSQIEIEDDNKELDSFLGPQIEEEQEAGASEEQYFEDDYLTDFAIKKDEEMIEEEEDNDLKHPFTLSGEMGDLEGSILQDKGAYPDSYLVRNDEDEAAMNDEVVDDRVKENNGGENRVEGKKNNEEEGGENVKESISDHEEKNGDDDNETKEENENGNNASTKNKKKKKKKSTIDGATSSDRESNIESVNCTNQNEDITQS